MKKQLYKIPINQSFFLYTCSAPKGNEDLKQEIASIKDQGLTSLVCLLSDEEILYLGLNLEANEALFAGLDYFHFPIEDFRIAEDEIGFVNLALELRDMIKDGKKVCIHCQAGIGRSSLLAAAILISFSFPPAHVFEHISKYRLVKVPDREVQANWLLSLSDQLLSN